MGGCASRPKDLDSQQAPVPVDNPEKAEGQTVPQESTNEAEAQKEEPSVDLSKPVQEAQKTEEANPEASAESSQEDSAKPTEEAKLEAGTDNQ